MRICGRFNDLYLQKGMTVFTSCIFYTLYPRIYAKPVIEILLYHLHKKV